MQTSVTFRQMDASDALKAYASERMDRVKKYLPDPISCHVVLSVERHLHRCDVNFQLHNGMTVAGHETTENMYSSIDLVIAKIERQVRKYKGKMEERRVRPHHIEPAQWSHSIVAEQMPGSAEAPPPPAYHVTTTEKMQAQPMTVEEAIVQMNLRHEEFLVFRRETDGKVAVVYRRDETSYGLIET